MCFFGFPCFLKNFPKYGKIKMPHNFLVNHYLYLHSLRTSKTIMKECEIISPHWVFAVFL